jgi:hypothetical protein
MTWVKPHSRDKIEEDKLCTECGSNKGPGTRYRLLVGNPEKET